MVCTWAISLSFYFFHTLNIYIYANPKLTKNLIIFQDKIANLKIATFTFFEIVMDLLY